MVRIGDGGDESDGDKRRRRREGEGRGEEVGEQERQVSTGADR